MRDVFPFDALYAMRYWIPQSMMHCLTSGMSQSVLVRLCRYFAMMAISRSRRTCTLHFTRYGLCTLTDRFELTRYASAKRAMLKRTIKLRRWQKSTKEHHTFTFGLGELSSGKSTCIPKDTFAFSLDLDDDSNWAGMQIKLRRMEDLTDRTWFHRIWTVQEKWLTIQWMSQVCTLTPQSIALSVNVT